MPLYDYQIAWWGEGLQFDNTEFNEVRKVFVAWMTGQMDDDTFFERQQAGNDRRRRPLRRGYQSPEGKGLNRSVSSLRRTNS